MEMAIYVRAMKTNVTKRFLRSEILIFVLKSLNPFTEATFSRYVDTTDTRWTTGALPVKRKAERLGTGADQSEVLTAIQQRTVKRVRSSLFR